MKEGFIKSFLSRIAYSSVGDRIVTFLGGERLHAELFVSSSKKRLLAEAKDVYKKGLGKGSFYDYKLALKKHWVSYSEYAYQYEFYKKSEEERDTYVSLLRMAYFYLRYGPGHVRPLFRNKKEFLKRFSQYVHREWIYVPDSSYEEFENLVSRYDCIVKPSDGTRGKRISKLLKDSNHDKDLLLYRSFVKEKLLLEQCIESCSELKQLHPQSLNTIRVVTFSNREKACVFSAVLRTGVGDSIIDNSHAGGISAQIDVQSGVVETDGANNRGERFVRHPDSGIVFKGFVIPKWAEIVSTCCSAAMQTDNPITGWDVAINHCGKVEFIEGNHTPDLDMMQTRYQAGFKKSIYSLIKEYCGIELK